MSFAAIEDVELLYNDNTLYYMSYGAVIREVKNDFEREMINIWVHQPEYLLCKIEMTKNVITYVLDHYEHQLMEH